MFGGVPINLLGTAPGGAIPHPGITPTTGGTPFFDGGQPTNGTAAPPLPLGVGSTSAPSGALGGTSLGGTAPPGGTATTQTLANYLLNGSTTAPAATAASGVKAEPGGSLPGVHEAFPNDEQNASTVIEHLQAAISKAKDPNLKESLSTALAAIHKHLANFQKERQNALQGKFSPRLMEQAHAIAGQQHSPIHGFGANGAFTNAPTQPGGVFPSAPHPTVDTGLNPALYQLSVGNTAQAANDWVAHHPYAMSHGLLPGWLSAYLAQHVANATPAAATNAPAPGFTAQ